jgi:hypothetical protein
VHGWKSHHFGFLSHGENAYQSQEREKVIFHFILFLFLTVIRLTNVRKNNGLVTTLFLPDGFDIFRLKNYRPLEPKGL